MLTCVYRPFPRTSEETLSDTSPLFRFPWNSSAKRKKHQTEGGLFEQSTRGKDSQTESLVLLFHSFSDSGPFVTSPDV